MTARFTIDGSFGEGGGQILRTALALSAITGRAIEIDHIRANRPRPGLAAQHLTAVRAAAAMCEAQITGDAVGSSRLIFVPQTVARAGSYEFDVAAARTGGSAGSTSLVLQTVFLPLALAEGPSRVSIRGGTHVAWSPPFDYLQAVWLPVLRRLGLDMRLRLEAWGWFPVGQGKIRAEIEGLGRIPAHPLEPLSVFEHGAPRGISGRAVAANLPSHIPQRMAQCARETLAPIATDVQIATEQVHAACPGAGIFLAAHYQPIVSGFSALGERGKRAEEVGEEAAQALLAHWRSGAALDLHLADQILLPLAFARGPSSYSTQSISQHLRSNAYVIERFGLARIRFKVHDGGAGVVHVTPTPAR